MRKVAHQIMIIYDWVSGPAMTERARMAYKIAVMSRGNLFLMLALLGTAVTVLSLLLDNVTTVVIFGPLIILIAKAQKISPIPYLLAAALLSDTGGIATLRRFAQDVMPNI